MADTIVLYVEAPNGQRFECEVPRDATFSHLAADFFEYCGWKTLDHNGREQRAVVELVDTKRRDRTRRLKGDQTVNEAGLVDGDVLLVFPETVAGGVVHESTWPANLIQDLNGMTELAEWKPRITSEAKPESERTHSRVQRQGCHSTHTSGELSFAPQDRAMTPREYEEWVAAFVSQLECFRTARLFRNHRFPGLRQPGVYEVDVAFEIPFEDVARFLLIIECKHWTRPVDRPIIQKLVQTRDAIAAQKAAVVSPIGFSPEAVAVAKVNGVALWVIAGVTWEVVCRFMRPPPWEMAFEGLRDSILGILGVEARAHPARVIVDCTRIPCIQNQPAEATETDLNWTLHSRVRETTSGYEFIGQDGTGCTAHCSTPGINPETAISDVVNWIVEEMRNVSALHADEISLGFTAWTVAVKMGLRKVVGLTEDAAAIALAAVMNGNREGFQRAIGDALPAFRDDSLDRVRRLFAVVKAG